MLTPSEKSLQATLTGNQCSFTVDLHFGCAGLFTDSEPAKTFSSQRKSPLKKIYHLLVGYQEKCELTRGFCSPGILASSVSCKSDIFLCIRNLPLAVNATHKQDKHKSLDLSKLSFQILSTNRFKCMSNI